MPFKVPLALIYTTSYTEHMDKQRAALRPGCAGVGGDTRGGSGCS